MRQGSKISSFADGLYPFNSFITKVPTRLSPNNPVFVNDGVYLNLCPGGIWDDPTNSSRVIFSIGEFTGFTTVGARIGYCYITKTDPYTLGVRQGTLLAGTPSTDDQNGCRFGCSVVHNGTIYYYYVGVDASFKWRIFLATSTNGTTFTKQGLMVDFNTGQGEYSVSDPTIVFDVNRWWMVYTVWDNSTPPLPNNNPGQSKVGMRTAWSTDLINWTKTNETILPLGASGAIDDNNVEGGQLFMSGDKKVLLYNANDGATWSIAMAYGDRWEVAFKKKVTAWFSKSVSGWDDLVVATALIHSFPSGDVMYYQASDGGDEELDIGAANLI